MHMWLAREIYLSGKVIKIIGPRWPLVTGGTSITICTENLVWTRTAVQHWLRPQLHIEVDYWEPPVIGFPGCACRWVIRSWLYEQIELGDRIDRYVLRIPVCATWLLAQITTCSCRRGIGIQERRRFRWQWCASELCVSAGDLLLWTSVAGVLAQCSVVIPGAIANCSDVEVKRCYVPTYILYIRFTTKIWSSST